MRDPLIGVMAVFGVFALIFVVLLGALAAYDTMADNDTMDGMWGMMKDTGGMMDDSMGDMMDGMMGSSNGPQTQGSATGRGEVTIEDFRFEPTDLNVTPGTVVRWTNQDAAPHTATAQDGSFDTGRLERDESAEVKFDKAGTFEYICELHPSMKGQIVVDSGP